MQISINDIKIANFHQCNDWNKLKLLPKGMLNVTTITITNTSQAIFMTNYLAPLPILFSVKLGTNLYNPKCAP